MPSRLNISLPKKHQHSWEVFAELEKYCSSWELPQIAITCWCGLTRVVERKDRRPIDFGDLDVHQIDAVLSALCTIARADLEHANGTRGHRPRTGNDSDHNSSATASAPRWSAR